MSTRSYLRLNPALKKVYDERVREAKRKDFKLLSDTVFVISAFFGIIGLCMANAELMVGSVLLLLFSKLTSGENI